MPDHPYPKALERFPRIRQSLAATFDNCALSSKFELEHARGWSSHPQGRGQLFHRFAARALAEMARQGEETIDQELALAILHEVLRQADVDDTCHEPGCDLPARLEEGRVRCDAGHDHRSSVVNIPMAEIKDLYWVVVKFATDNRWDIGHLVDVEKRLEATVNYPDPRGGHVERELTGQLDALFLAPDDAAHAICLDWKDTWGLPGPTDVSFEGYFQQRFYAWLVMRNFRSIERVTLREFYVRYSEPREASIGREALEDIEAELAALAERLDRSFETENFTPSPGKHCQFCARPTACPIPVFARGEGRITDEEQAAKVAAQLTVAEEVVDRAKSSLRAYVDTHGAVPVKDAKGRSEWAYKAYTRTGRPKREDLEQALRLAGAAEAVDLERLYPTSQATRFQRVQVAPDRDEREDGELLARLEESVRQA